MTEDRTSVGDGSCCRRRQYEGVFRFKSFEDAADARDVTKLAEGIVGILDEHGIRVARLDADPTTSFIEMWLESQFDTVFRAGGALTFLAPAATIRALHASVDGTAGAIRVELG